MAGTGTKHIPEAWRHVFGPVFSRRLGLSLGVDMVPRKTCTYNCVYCEVGPTTHLISGPRPFWEPEEIVEEIEEALKVQRPDVLTFCGSGEPLLNSNIKEILREVKRRTSIRTALLTNGILFYESQSREVFPYLDLIIPTMSTGSQETFQRLHRPHPGVDYRMLREAFRATKRDFRGEIWVEVMLVSGINDTAEEWKRIGEFLSQIGPHRIQVGTVERPPAFKEALPVSELTVKEAVFALGEKAEPISGNRNMSPVAHGGLKRIVETLKRRPLLEEELRYLLGVEGLKWDHALETLKRDHGLIKIRQEDREFYAFKEEG